MKLSKSFTLEEFIASQVAERKGIDNTPDETQVENMRVLCENVLEPIRALIQKPIIISSGYRSPELNAAINGSETSHIWKVKQRIFCVAPFARTNFSMIYSNQI